jgi:hypothetical protein
MQRASLSSRCLSWGCVWSRCGTGFGSIKLANARSDGSVLMFLLSYRFCWVDWGEEKGHAWRGGHLASRSWNTLSIKQALGWGIILDVFWSVPLSPRGLLLAVPVSGCAVRLYCLMFEEWRFMCVKGSSARHPLSVEDRGGGRSRDKRFIWIWQSCG